LKSEKSAPSSKFDRNLLPDRPDLSYEIELWQRGECRVGGIDEAGRGAWAGPVAAGCVVLPDDPHIFLTLTGVRDSKEMTPTQREKWSLAVKAQAVTWGVGWASEDEIDRLGILPATRLAMRRSIAALAAEPQHLLIDFVRLPEVEIPQTALVKGDARSLSIAAASVLAKTARDALMRELDGAYPGYGFAAHKGYGTRQHMQAIQNLGVCPIHRRTFSPLKEILSQVVQPEVDFAKEYTEAERNA
jgi:ribonuclease HII